MSDHPVPPPELEEFERLAWILRHPENAKIHSIRITDRSGERQRRLGSIDVLPDRLDKIEDRIVEFIRKEGNTSGAYELTTYAPGRNCRGSATVEVTVPIRTLRENPAPAPAPAEPAPRPASQVVVDELAAEIERKTLDDVKRRVRGEPLDEDEEIDEDEEEEDDDTEEEDSGDEDDEEPEEIEEKGAFDKWWEANAPQLLDGIGKRLLSSVADFIDSKTQASNAKLIYDQAIAAGRTPADAARVVGETLAGPATRTPAPPAAPPFVQREKLTLIRPTPGTNPPGGKNNASGT